MLKRLTSVLILSFTISNVGFAAELWHCIATNKDTAVWNRYGSTRESAGSLIEGECKLHNNNVACSLVCFPPRVYWRCPSHDMPPVSRDNKNILKQGTWYWASFSKQIAINGARDACRHNSAFGGCYVDPNACTSS